MVFHKDIPEGQCFEDSVYTIGFTRLTWDDAKAACLNMDANLVEIDKDILDRRNRLPLGRDLAMD
uniref:C-type lectin domain-containing protein n=1 Tax=Magallana gigas TaxID=29159 RepID=K1P0M8_MAGGI